MLLFRHALRTMFFFLLRAVYGDDEQIDPSGKSPKLITLPWHQCPFFLSLYKEHSLPPIHCFSQYWPQRKWQWGNSNHSLLQNQKRTPITVKTSVRNNTPCIL
uniref:Uncharacterized protein n=1 Tax=Sphaerodactylus townsendi TaxID=933632 RepID=A0ACB8ELA6_9SAUR